MSMPSPRDTQTLFESGTCAGLTDLELLERFRARRDAGAERAFAALVDRHGPLVLRTCRALLGDRDDAEDAFQVTFLVLARKAGSIRGRDSLPAWLHGVARRTSKCARGALARRRRHERAASLRIHEAVPGTVPDDLPALIHEEVGRLPARLRAAVLLCEFEGLSGEEAAARLGCPIGTVKSRLSRARDRLRKRLQGRDLAPAIAGTTTLPLGMSNAVALKACGRGAESLISAAIAAWEVEVLRSLFFVRVKFAALCLSCVALLASAAWVANAQSTPSKSRTPAEPKAQTAREADIDHDAVALLARSHLHIAQKMMLSAHKSYLDGKGDLETYLRSVRRCEDAFLAAYGTPERRQRVLRASLRGASSLERTVKTMVEDGKAKNSDLDLATYHRVETALRLAEAASGVISVTESEDWKRYTEPGRLSALLDSIEAKATDRLALSLLDQRVELDYPEPVTLAEVLKSIKGQTASLFDNGLAILVHPDGLKKSNATLDSRVKVVKFSGTVREAFAKILDPIGLAALPTGGILHIKAK